jgi:hypothetical protein
VQRLIDRGFGYGYGHLSPDNTKFLVSIPKNASSFLSEATMQNRWTGAIVDNNSNEYNVQEMVVVLRDPLERWISGFAQYLQTYILYPFGPNTPQLENEQPTAFDYDMGVLQLQEQYTQLTERLIFDVINRFDDHVWPQIDIFKNLLPMVPRKYFYIDDNFNEKISQYLDLDLNNVTNSNNSESNQVLKDIQKFFRERLAVRPELARRIRNSYAEDYKLIEQIRQ